MQRMLSTWLVDWGRTQLPRLVAIGLVLGLAVWLLRRLPRRMARRGARVLLRLPVLLVVVVLALLIRGAVLHGHVRWADEWSCLWQAEVFAGGRLWAPALPGGPDVVSTWVVLAGERTYSMYPPGWPFLLAVFRLVRLEGHANLILGLALILVCTREARRRGGRGSAVLTGLFLGSCSFTLFMLGTWYSHVSSALLLTSGILLLLPRNGGVALRRNWVLSGALFGAALLVRPFTAIALAGGAGLGILLATPDRRTVLARGVLLLPGLTVGAALILLHNQLLSGDPLLFGHLTQRTAYTKFGMGWQGVFFAGVYLSMLPLWGIAVVPVAAAAGVILRKHLEPPVRCLVCAAAGGFAGLVLGYAFFQTWQSGGYGPRFYFEAYPLLCLATALVLRRSLLKTAPGGLPRSLRFLTVWSLVFALAVFLPFKAVSEQQRIRPLLAADRFEETIERPSVLFIASRFGDLVRNPVWSPGLLVRAHLTPGHEQEVLDAYPGRDAYILDESGRIAPWPTPR